MQRNPRPRLSRRLIPAALILCAAGGCRDRDQYPSRPITLVCPWAAGGGTDRVSRQVAAHLEQVLGEPVNVINATGGKGVTGHARGLYARPDGYTIAMITLELNMMHWSKLTELTYNDCIPLMSLNEDAAAIFVQNDAPWQNLSELEQAIGDQPGELIASGTATGGAWHLALAGWLLAAGMEADAVKWISSEGAGPSLQGLIGGGFDFVCCSLPEADNLLRSGELRSLGVMAEQRVAGYDDVPTFQEQGTDWTFVGWRGLAVPLDTPPEVVETLTAAIEQVVTGQTRDPNGKTFPELMEAQRFDHTSRPADEFRTFLAETDEKLGMLLTSEAMRSVNTDPFDPMAFPWAIIGLMVLTAVAIAIQASRTQSHAPIGAEAPPKRSLAPHGVRNFALFVVAVVVYLLLAEVVGFVLLSAALLFAMLCLLNVRVLVAAPVAIVFAALVNQMFAHQLRVPLPRGLWGW